MVAKDAQTPYCAVYTSSDIEHAMHKYLVKKQNLRVVGNPDLVKFGLNEDDFGICCSVDVRKKISCI